VSTKIACLPAAIVAIAVMILAGDRPIDAIQAEGGSALKVGILPFVDATASGNRAVGADVGRTMQAEIVHSTSMLPRMLTLEGSMRPEDLDPEKAVDAGRKAKVDVVFVGTVLDATSEESNKGGFIPFIKGQAGQVQVRSIKASVTLQGEVYRIPGGERLASWRVTGKHSDNKFGGTAYTTLGSWGHDNYEAFLTSPLGKALQDAIADLVKKLAAVKVPAAS
jgi:hypothetical protein